MLPDAHLFQLEVQQVNQTCLFKLSWGNGQRLRAALEYPQLLTRLYQHWQRLYFNFYRTLEVPSPLQTHPPMSSLRGRVAESGNVTSPPPDWHAELVEAEARFLYEFHRWLRSAELFEIRVTIAQVSAQVNTQASTQASLQARQQQRESIANASYQSYPSPFVPVFLTCTPLDLARFPWETWEIGTEFAASRAIRIVRTPENIHAETVLPRRRNRARILAILGDDTGLDFQIDRMAVQSLSRLAEVHFVGWQPDQHPETTVKRIQQAIDDEQGWDILFFAGHSNERAMTGGELSIAPGLSIAIREITPQLQAARKRGLQFALFNSCRGLNLAESLIDLGFSQVAIMREPIHNQVAQEFLISFLQNLAQYKDVQESLFAACQILKTEKNLTYPSAYLIPSLFCHPGATLFRLKPRLWKHPLTQLLPTRSEAIALLIAVVLLSPLSPLPDLLLDWRTFTQALWQNWTRQLVVEATPPVALIQIDSDSIRRDTRLSDPTPIDRAYLAELIQSVTAAKARIIGVDYLLDELSPSDKATNDRDLSNTVKQAIDKQKTWFVWGKTFWGDGSKEDGLTVNSQIASFNWSLAGAVHLFSNSHEFYAPNLFPNYVVLPDLKEGVLSTGCQSDCPFAYLLALVAIAQPKLPDEQQPQLNSQKDLRSQFLPYISQQLANDHRFAFLQQAPSAWFDPIIDFSIPPKYIFDRIPAYRVIEKKANLSQISQQVVLIAGGNYGEFNSSDESDSYLLPLARRYWQDQPLYSDRSTILTGGEVHAYMVQHFLTQHLILPIPDPLMGGVAILVSQGLRWHLQQLQRQNRWSPQRRKRYWLRLVSATALYGLLGLQLYISADILLPWLVPVSLTWFYLFPVLWRNPNAFPPSSSL